MRVFVVALSLMCAVRCLAPITIGGGSNRLQFGDVTEMDAVTGFTFTFLANRGAANGVISLGKQYSTNDYDWIGVTIYSDGNIYCDCAPDISTTTYASASDPNNDGRWHHYAYAYDGNQAQATNRVRLYVDGTLRLFGSFVGTFPATSGDTTNLTTLNAGNTSTGQIADIRLFNRTLTANEVQNIALGKIRFGPSMINLVHYWTINEIPDGSSAINLFIPDRVGTMHGTALGTSLTATAGTVLTNP